MFKFITKETTSLNLPENLQWISLSRHPHTSLIRAEISAIEEELIKYDKHKKNLKQIRKDLERECKILRLISEAQNHSIPPDERPKIFIIVSRKPKPREISEHSEEKEKEKPAQIDKSDEPVKQDDEQAKKKKYIILVKHCECCGLEVKRHLCKHTNCAKPCARQIKQLEKKEKLVVDKEKHSTDK